MIHFDFLSVFKHRAKIQSRNTSVKLSVIHEELANDAGFNNFHELQAVARRCHKDSRLFVAAFGSLDIPELIYSAGLFWEFNSRLEDLMSGRIAETNAGMYVTENLEVESWATMTEHALLELHIFCEYNGEHDDTNDRLYSGSSFGVEAKARLTYINGYWKFCESFGKAGVELISSVGELERPDYYH